jgi:hypothetical protein
MIEPIAAWQCIGCGRIEAPQTCIGVCQDRRVEFVYAAEYAEVQAELAAARSTLASAARSRDTLDAIVRRLAFSHPRAGEWERSYRALQAQARCALRPGSETDEANPAMHDAMRPAAAATDAAA